MKNFDPNQPTNATNGGIVVTGTASLGEMGTFGQINIGESEDSYFLSVSLPGVKKNNGDFVCEFEPDGSVMIKGITTAGEEKVIRNGITFQMQTQNFCPIGRFSISFKLPGPIRSNIHGCFGNNGILECILMKDKASR